MNTIKSVAEWMAERGLRPEDVVAAAAVDRKVLAAILEGRYTPSPQQRERIAAALGVERDAIAWGHRHEVQHLYGHGPQFGRTP